MFNHIPSRKERKALAKKLGLVKKKETFKERIERIARAQEVGKQLHLLHLQNIENQRKLEEIKKEEKPQSLTPSSWEQQEWKKIISEFKPEE